MTRAERKRARRSSGQATISSRLPMSGRPPCTRLTSRPCPSPPSLIPSSGHGGGVHWRGCGGSAGWAGRPRWSGVPPPPAADGVRVRGARGGHREQGDEPRGGRRRHPCPPCGGADVGDGRRVERGGEPARRKPAGGVAGCVLGDPDGLDHPVPGPGDPAGLHRGRVHRRTTRHNSDRQPHPAGPDRRGGPRGIRHRCRRRPAGRGGWRAADPDVRAALRGGHQTRRVVVAAGSLPTMLVAFFRYSRDQAFAVLAENKRSSSR